MPQPSFIPTQYGVIKKDVNVGLVASGNITFGNEPTSDNLTTEKDTSGSTLALTQAVHPDSLFLLSVERPASTTDPRDAGDLTIKTYNVDNLTGSNERNVLHTIHVISSAIITTNRDFLVQGLFSGQGEANLGFSFATDRADTMKIYYKLFRL